MLKASWICGTIKFTRMARLWMEPVYQDLKYCLMAEFDCTKNGDGILVMVQLENPYWRKKYNRYIIMKTRCAFLTILCLFLWLHGQAQTNPILSGSTKFKVKFIFGTCSGTFDAPNGKVQFKESELDKSYFDLKVPVESFNTSISRRDKDMKSDAYFNVAKYPDIHFKSTKVYKKGDAFETIGMMKIKDVSKEVILPFTAEKQSDGSTLLKSNFTINRLDYKVGEKSKKMKEEVELEMTLQLGSI
jgi:polyisoprenoid-binding protein YceI